MASVCRDELEAVLLSMGTFFPIFILSGIGPREPGVDLALILIGCVCMPSGVVWPLEGMPFYLKNIAYALPCTLGGETMRSIIGRGVPFTHRSVWPGFLSTAIYVCLYCALTLGVFRMRKRK